jgi:hypothetical protein
MVPVIYGEAVLFALSMAIICYHYVNNKNCMRTTYIKIFDMLLKNL